MSLFKRERPSPYKLPEVPDADKINNAEEVMQTIESLGVPLDMCVAVGGSALALLGLMRCAHDVDLAVHPSILLELDAALFNGAPVIALPKTSPGPGRFIVETKPLESDLFSHKIGSMGRDRSTFTDFYDNAVPTKHGVRIAKPYSLLTRTNGRVVNGDTTEERARKYALRQYDRELLEQYHGYK